LDNYTNIRAAATYSYARPNFSEIIPAQEINREDRIATLGNADLKPVSALNLDLMMEHYFGSVGIASVGLFHKQLDDFIYRRILFNSPYPVTGTPSIPSIDIIQAQNGNEAFVTGLELALQRRLYFIPALKNFSLYLNYTYTHSKADIQSRDANETNPNATETIRLPGQATHVGNASLAYEGKRFAIRPSINFNGAFISEVGGSVNDDIYVQNRMQLDLSATYTINRRLRLFTEWMNLTNQPLEVYQGDKTMTIQKEYYSFWTRFGVKFNW
jgi:TonB-dependent receptor